MFSGQPNAKAQASAIASWLSAHNVFLTHARPIPRDVLTARGLTIRDLESNRAICALPDLCLRERGLLVRRDTEIRRSAFLVADFTEHRQNVYFETGFAIGLARQVVWTCRKDQIKDLHFDIRQYNCIDWKDAADLAKRLQVRIEATFGRGPLIS